MKRILVIFIKISLFLAGFVISLYIFFPWRSAGEFALSVAHNRLQKMGLALSYSDISGGFGSFAVNNLSVSGFTRFSAESIALKPDIPGTFLAFSPVFEISFTNAGLFLGTLLRLGSGSLLLTVASNLSLDDIHSDGEVSLDGYIVADISALKIVRANARLTVPEHFSRSMDTLKSFLPLVLDGGHWYLRRE